MCIEIYHLGSPARLPPISVKYWFISDCHAPVLRLVSTKCPNFGLYWSLVDYFVYPQYSSKMSHNEIVTCSVTRITGAHMWRNRCHSWPKKCQLWHQFCHMCAAVTWVTVHVTILHAIYWRGYFTVDSFKTFEKATTFLNFKFIQGHCECAPKLSKSAKKWANNNALTRRTGVRVVRLCSRKSVFLMDNKSKASQEPQDRLTGKTSVV